jgi:tryptophan halogenase
MRNKFEQVRDFVILHYSATERDDSPFWNYCRTMEVPDSLKHRIALFREAGRIFRYDEELFTPSSWVAVLIGQGITPKSQDPIVSTLPADEVVHSLGTMNAAMEGAADKMPTHEEFIARYCPAPAD